MQFCTRQFAYIVRRDKGVSVAPKCVDERSFLERGDRELCRGRSRPADAQPQSVLGTSLIDETTRLGRERTSFRDVIAYYLGARKRRAEQATGRELRDVVHGRPVHFVDNAPDADRKAEQTLRQIAREIGFDEVTFQFEPIAAALDYERQISTEEIALIADTRAVF
jgi:molecular chaperone DnaK (HSP70)